MNGDLLDTCASVVCLGFDGTDSAHLDPRLFEYPFAGYILFARNVVDVSQTRDLTQALQQGANGKPRIVAIDQEGGRVARLRAGVEQLPPMMAVAAANDPQLARRAGAQMGFDLTRAGVNLDFAPVLDLALFEKNTVIGARSFGDTPQRVIEFAKPFAQGLRDAGIAYTYKHFPGHGSTEVDSHLDLPVIDLDRDVFLERDVVPFQALLADAPAVMTAHIVVHAFDPQRAATISHTVLNELLRERCRFDGVCFTDCMEMDAIAKGVGSVQGGVAAIAAGADCVLVSHTLEIAIETVRALAKAVEDGRLEMSRLQQASARVNRLRSEIAQRRALQDEAPYRGIGREIARRAVTVIRGQASARASESVAVSFEGTTIEGVQGKHSQHAAIPTADLQTLRLPLEPGAAGVDATLADLRTIAKRPIVLMRRAHIYRSQHQAVKRILNEYPDALVVSTREPYDALTLPQARHLLCIYGDDQPCMEGLADVIFGGEPARGVLPVHYA